MRGIQVERYGGPEELKYGELPDPAPGAGEVLVRVRVAGVNFTDMYQRTGTYPGALPFTPGVEGVGIVEKLGSGVTEREGRRPRGMGDDQGRLRGADRASSAAARADPERHR